MKPARIPFLSGIGAIITVLSCSVNSAQVLNGDFSGGLAGWTVTAFDPSFAPIDPSPFIAPTSVAGSPAVKFQTGTFSQGLLVAEISQSITVTAGTPIFSFDFTLPSVSIDATGAGTSPDSDIFSATISPNADLMMVDRDGTITPGPGFLNITITPSSTPGFDRTLTADLTPLIGAPFALTLRFNVSQSDDGFLFDPFLDNVTLAPIPEPSRVGLVFGLLCICISFRKRLLFKKSVQDI